MEIAPSDDIATTSLHELRQASASAPRSSGRIGPVLTTLLVLPVAALLLTPFGLIAAAAAERPEILLVLADKPLAAAQLLAGLIISLLFCALPFRRAGATTAHLSPAARKPADGFASRIPEELPVPRQLAA